MIARLNMGGPAHHVGLLSSRLDPQRYETLLLHGEVGGHEDSLEPAVRDLGVSMARVPGLRPELVPPGDARALAGLIRAIRRLRPHILHTHTAKAGMLGRTAALMAGAPRPLIVHTYHGHVLEGYFGPLRNATYRGFERGLARASDALIGVSRATVDDLVRLGVAPPDRFRVIPIGLELHHFVTAAPGDRAAFRAECGVRDSELLLTFVGRLVPIKRVDVLLDAFSRARELGAPVRLALVGDGELRGRLERQAADLGVSEHLTFAGYRADVVPVAASSDIAVLSSDSEGTPVSLIEASAAGAPSAATAVGGVPEVVTAESGLLAPAGDAEGLARAIARLAGDEPLRRRMGAAAQRHVTAAFGAERLVGDIDLLYQDLIAVKTANNSERGPLDEPRGAG